jgi:hypothetical protein
MASMPPQPPGTPPPPGRPPGPPSGPPYGQQPYGAPFGVPYGANPKDYWRFQKDQNKAAWRAQRDAWRAQRNMARAQNRAMRTPSIAGPIILITVGILALLLITGHLDSDRFWTVIEHWWPMLLIGLGLIALAEWAIDLRRENPPARHFGGYIWLIVLLVILGAGGTGFHHWWGPLRAQFGDDNDDFFNALGQPQHNLDQPVMTTQIPANAQIEIDSPRGDVSISQGDGQEVTVKAHQVAFARSDAEANKIFDSQKAHVSVSGTAVVVKVDANSSGRTNLAITVPKSASVNVNTSHGAVTVAGLSGSVDAEVHHGGIEATDITGHVHARISNNGDFSAHDIKGDVTVEGSGGDLTLSDVHGKVVLQGEYSGDIHLERADQTVNFHSSRTDLELGRLPGDMSMSLDSLHVTQAVGPVRVVTHSKDIEMTQIYGDTHIEDRDARVELGMAGSFPVEVKNNKGDIEISLPPNFNGTLDGRTHNGDIVSDFPVSISGDENKTASGNIGSGGSRLTLSTEHADLRIRKGDEASSAPPPPATPKGPAAPKAPAAPHLKAAKEPVEPVTQ